MHPSQIRQLYSDEQKSHQLRENKRDIHIIFSGNIGVVKDKHLVERFYGLPSRDRIAEQIIEKHTEYNAFLIENEHQRKQILSNPNIYKQYNLLFCLFKGYPNKWFKELAASNFFLALPGSHMLMSHNVIEAMSVGTIPILSYPEWLYPNLINNVNCLIYKDTADLHRIINSIRNISDKDIFTMRENVLFYFEKYLHIDKIAKRIKKLHYKYDEFTIYMNNENADILKDADKGSVLHNGGTIKFN